MQPVKRIGIDLAKNTFAICGVDANDIIILERSIKRADLLQFFSNLTPCLVAMEAGSGAHHWARELIGLGHDARIIDSRFVSPYRKRGTSAKNDRNDARAICEAAGRPDMRFVPVKHIDQQGVLLIHRCRQAAVREHTKTVNQIRGLLAEFGIVLPVGVRRLKKQWAGMRQANHDGLPAMAWDEIDQLYDKLTGLHQQVRAYDRKILELVRADERAGRLMQVPGIGPLTASAVVATVGDAKVFKNGRQFAAWLGLTPRQYSTGGKSRLGRISKRGNSYLRTLLVHGARAELRYLSRRNDARSQWAQNLRQTKSYNQTAVALANKHARVVWVILAKEQDYQPA